MPSSGSLLQGTRVQGVRVSGYWSKWLTFSAATLVMLSAGLGYTFSVWSNMLKTHFNYSQTQVAGVGTAGNMGGYLGIIAGPFYDAMRSRDRLGPWLTLNIGVVVHLVGYLSLWAAAKGFFNPPYWAVVILAMVACNGQTWFETGSLVTCVRNFETERGTVIGVLKAFLGLSASLYVTLYMSFLDPDATSFLLLLALGPALTVALCALVINYVPYIQVEPHTKSHAFHLAFTAVVGMAAYQAAIAFARNSGALQFWAGFLVTCATAMLLLPILSIPWIFGGLMSRRLDSDISATSSEKALWASRYPELVPFMADEGTDDDDGEVDERFQDVYRDKTPLKCLRSQSFWMLFIINAIGSGAGLTLNNNLAQQVLALDPKSSATSVFVSVFSVASCAGRLCSGFLPDKWMRERNVPRTVSLIGLMALTTASAGLNAFISMPLMPIAAFLTGFTFGGIQGVVPAVTSEIFGLRSFATNYALVQLGPATGSYALATLLAGHVYEREGRAHGDPAGTCRGSDCFRWTFLLLTTLSFLALGVAVMLWRRTQHLYAKVIEHTRTERQRRGLAGEVAERKRILRRVVEENKLLQSVLTRGKEIVASLEQQLREGTVDRAVAVEQGLAALQALGLEASSLLSMQAEMYERLEKLSPQAQ